jgi:hypothetical protein
MDAREEAQRRQAVKEVYSGSTEWPDKVDKMSIKQLTAIYLKFKAEGKVK